MILGKVSKYFYYEQFNVYKIKIPKGGNLLMTENGDSATHFISKFLYPAKNADNAGTTQIVGKRLVSGEPITVSSGDYYVYAKVYHKYTNGSTLNYTTDMTFEMV